MAGCQDRRLFRTSDFSISPLLSEAHVNKVERCLGLCKAKSEIPELI